MDFAAEKAKFGKELKTFADSHKDRVSRNGEWTVKGFIDVFKNIYTISTDTKIVSKVLELHVFPPFLDFAERIGCNLELATYQNWYPDLTFVSKQNPEIKFAVDLKTRFPNSSHIAVCPQR